MAMHKPMLTDEQRVRFEPSAWGRSEAAMSITPRTPRRPTIISSCEVLSAWFRLATGCERERRPTRAESDAPAKRGAPQCESVRGT